LRETGFGTLPANEYREGGSNSKPRGASRGKEELGQRSEDHEEGQLSRRTSQEGRPVNAESGVYDTGRVRVRRLTDEE